LTGPTLSHSSPCRRKRRQRQRPADSDPPATRKSVQRQICAADRERASERASEMRET
jgi:hypothetical protein